jgi:hypothetical protein
MRVYKLFENKSLTENEIRQVRHYLKTSNNFVLIDAIRKYELLRTDRQIIKEGGK